MTTVEFHTGIADPLAFACRLLRKACRSGARVLVLAPAERVAALDRLLWTFDDRDFVPHLRLDTAGRPASGLAARTPLWLSDGPVPDGAPGVLVNLGLGVPADLAPFTRIIEVVGAVADEADAGRERWRRYKAEGLTVHHHAASAPSRDADTSNDE